MSDANRTAAPFRIIILGGGTAGWMTANLMAKRWRSSGWAGRPVAISVIESPDIGIIGVGEGSTPQLKSFFSGLGIEEKDWMPACNATYKNGISFEGWSDDPDYPHYFHPFPSPIDIHSSPAFYFHSHYRRQGYDLDALPDRFFLSARLAANRLAPLASQNFPFDIAYGYHFDAYLVGAFLRDHARTLGVTHIEAAIADVSLNEAGDIDHVTDRDGRDFAADFFVDSTGFRSLLLQGALGVPFHSFAKNLFNDAAVVMPTPIEPNGLNSQTLAIAMKHGWRWNIPLTNRSGNGYVYSSRYCDASEAEGQLRASLGLLESDVDARHLSMKVGQVEKHWHRNCLAVGLSQGFIEPLEATALHLVQATVEGFIERIEAGNFTPAQREAFNADIAARFEGVRDYIVCHYRANKRTDTAYWHDNANNNAHSDRLHEILTTWFSGGDMKQMVERLNLSRYYSLTSWLCLLGGYGNYPAGGALKPPTPQLNHFDLNSIDNFMSRALLNFRDHRDVLSEREHLAKSV